MTTNAIDQTLPPCRSTLLSAVRACLAAAGDDRDLAEVAGLTGLAFYLNVDSTVSPSGVAAYPWAQELPGMVSRLGYESELVYSDDEDPQFDRAQERAARVAAGALSRVLELLLGQGDPGHLDARRVGQVHAEAAPAGADVEHPVVGREQELCRDVALFVLLRLVEIVYDGPPDGLTPDVLTEIYGEEDWEATIRKVEDEDETGEEAAPAQHAPEPDRERLAGMT